MADDTTGEGCDPVARRRSAARPSVPCGTPGCGGVVGDGGRARCPTCRARMPRTPPTAAGYDHRWTTRARQYLCDDAHAYCALCGRIAQVPDHYPRSRKQLVRAGVDDPDADQYLRPLCRRCHNRESGRNQPGGWNAQRH